MYQHDYVPIKPANLNDYFVRYKETNYRFDHRQYGFSYDCAESGFLR